MDLGIVLVPINQLSLYRSSVVGSSVYPLRIFQFDGISGEDVLQCMFHITGSSVGALVGVPVVGASAPLRILRFDGAGVVLTCMNHIGGSSVVVCHDPMTELNQTNRNSGAIMY